MKKRLLIVMITVLAAWMLAACGGSKEASSDSVKDKKGKVESEVEKDTEKDDKNNLEFSGDGGAPVEGDNTDGKTDIDIEVVEPVANSFILMSEDGTTIICEGAIPAGLTLVDGNGTSHIEFAYNDCPDAIVYFDVGIDNDVLALVKDNVDKVHSSPIYSAAEADAYVEFFNNMLTHYNISIDSVVSNYDERSEVMVEMHANNIVHSIGLELNKYISCENVDYRNETCDFCVLYRDMYGFTIGETIYLDDPDASNEFGYSLAKVCVVDDKDKKGFPEHPYTVTMIVNQPDVSSLTLEEIEYTYYCGNGYDNYSAAEIYNILSNIVNDLNK